MVPNGCEYEHFDRPARFREEANAQSIIGYIGSLQDWFDWDAVMAVAKRFPMARVRVAGPLHTKPRHRTENLELMGPVPYADAPRFVSECTVCHIPFRTSKVYIKAVSPIKLYEYLAAGKPVVSAPMSDTCKLEGDGIVYLAEKAEQYCAQVERALAVADVPELIRTRKDIARNNSWKSRWRAVEELIDRLLRERRLARPHGQ